MWLRPIEVTSWDGSILRLRAPNSYVRIWFEHNFMVSLVQELRELGHEHVRVEFDPDSEGRPAPAPEPLALAAGSIPTRIDAPAREASAQGSDARIELVGERDTAPRPHMNAHGYSAPPSYAFNENNGSPASRAAEDASYGAASEHAPTAEGAANGTPPSTSTGTTNRTTSQPSSHRATNLEEGPTVTAPDAATLNPRYTFETFVAGPSNQLAFAASQAAASSYPPKYNPVFLCGGVGLGKTHLLHAIGHQQLANRPGSRIVYISAERFMNEFVHMIRVGKMHEFRRNYREGIDVLLIDDVQFLAGKESTQDEFFHTFNALHENHKQIVLTADRKPHEISDIADRLRTRFAWGLLADIEPPELEVRIAILRKKAAVEAVQLPDDVALYIATAIKSNVRELEGALIRLAAYASLSKRRIDLEFAQETLGAALTRPREVITVELIIKAVANYYGLKPTDIKSDRRHKSLANPRAIAMYIARHNTKDSYPDLARAFGGKHHTTVISAVQKIEQRLKEDAGLRSEIHAIQSMVLK